jgi:hypothetical protein
MVLGSVFLKENLVLVLKLRPNSGTILGNVFFWGEILPNFDLKNMILTCRYAEVDHPSVAKSIQDLQT